MSEKPTIGFIGVGFMGHGMAANILKNGYPLIIKGNQNRTPIDDLVKKGAVEAESIATLMKSADIIHRQVIRELLGDVCDSDLKKEEALESIDLALSSLNNFLSGMERVYC